MISRWKNMGMTPSRLAGQLLTVGSLLKQFTGPISVTWFLTLCETTLMALVPLFIGLAIDGLLKDDPAGLMNLGLLFGTVLVVVETSPTSARAASSLPSSTLMVPYARVS